MVGSGPKIENALKSFFLQLSVVGRRRLSGFDEMCLSEFFSTLSTAEHCAEKTDIENGRPTGHLFLFKENLNSLYWDKL